MALGLTCRRKGEKVSKNIEFKNKIEKTEKYVMLFSILGMSSALSLIVSALLS